MSEETKRSGHSVLGIVSILLGFCGIALLFLAEYSGWDRSLADKCTSLCLFLVGLALGFTDIFRERKKLLFPILGILFNGTLSTLLLFGLFIFWALSR